MAGLQDRLVGVELAGRYLIKAKLSEGGMGLVYRAWDSHLGAEVVVKVPRETLLSDPQFVSRFSREVRSLVRLKQPHIVSILDVGNHEGLPFVVLQYLSGGNLKDRHDGSPDGRAAPPSSLQTWLMPIAEALDFIHSQKCIHRDVKPANILFDESGYVYLSDFGVVKVSQEFSDESLTQTGTACGTPSFMAPEMFTGQPCEKSVDQYALAVSVYELLAGIGPFDGMPIAVLIARKTARPIPPLHEVAPRVTRALSAAVARAMSVNPADRFPDCVAFARAVLQGVSASSAPSSHDVVTLPAAGNQLDCPSCHTPLQIQVPPGTTRLRCSACSADLSLSSNHARLYRVALAEQDTNDAAILRLSCPHCDRRLRISSTMWEKSVRCPGCAQRFFAGRASGMQGSKAPDETRRPVPVAMPIQAQGETRPDALGRARTQPSATTRPKRLRPRRRRWGRALLLTFLILAAGAGVAFFLWPVTDAPGEPITRDDVVTGTVDIDFNSRKDVDEKGNPRPGAKDTYRIDLRVQTRRGMRVAYNGTIQRTPEVGVGGPEKAPASVELHQFQISVTAEPLNLFGRPSANKSTPLGVISHEVVRTEKGRYLFKDLHWTTSLGSLQKYRGEVQGIKIRRGDEPEKTDRELLMDAGGERVRIPVKKSDPMIFHELVMPADESLGIPETTVTGELVFSYETSSYYTNNLVFTSGNHTDRVQGIISWKKDSDYAQNGRSEYVFNLLFNPKVAEGSGANTSLGSDKSLLDLGASSSALRGSIEYIDEGRRTVKDGETEIKPYHSAVTYHLHVKHLSPIQIHTFLRLWLLMSGPVNDE